MISPLDHSESSAGRYDCVVSLIVPASTRSENRFVTKLALALDSTGGVQRAPYRKDRGLIFQQNGPKQSCSIRDLFKDHLGEKT